MEELKQKENLNEDISKNNNIAKEIDELFSDEKQEYLPDIMVNNDISFHGNSQLKPMNAEAEFTPEHIEELKRCMNDPVYFAERYIKILHVDKGVIPIQLYPYQKRILKGLHEHRYSIILSCRQSGKCVDYDTIIKIRNKNYNNGIPFQIKIGDFYTWLKFRNN